MIFSSINIIHKNGEVIIIPIILSIYYICIVYLYLMIKSSISQLKILIIKNTPFSLKIFYNFNIIESIIRFPYVIHYGHSAPLYVSMSLIPKTSK